MSELHEYRIHDAKGLIASFDWLEEAQRVFDSAPNEDIDDWTGDLVLVEVLAVRR